MLKILLVGTGGFIGSIFRYLLGEWIPNGVFSNPHFPYGTFAANMTGCFLIGLLGGFVHARNGITPELRLFLFVGMLGGFTTFSSFGYDTFILFNNGKIFMAGINVVLQVFIGLIAVWSGYNIAGICF